MAVERRRYHRQPSKPELPFATKAMLFVAASAAGVAIVRDSRVGGILSQFHVSFPQAAAETYSLPDLSPYQMAVELDDKELLEYSYRKYGLDALVRRDFEPDVIFHPSVEAWRPYVMRAIYEFNKEHGLKLDDPKAPTVLEFLQIINIETCGAAWDSSSAALWPAGVVAKWHPIQATNEYDKWLNIKAGVAYFGEGLSLSERSGLKGKEAVLRAYAFYNGSIAGFNLEKEQAILEMERAREWMEGVDIPVKVQQSDGSVETVYQHIAGGQEYINWWNLYAYGCRLPDGWSIWKDSQTPKLTPTPGP